MSGLGVILLYLGSVFEVLDITLAALASFIVVFFVIEFSKLQALALFIVTGILAFDSAEQIPRRNVSCIYRILSDSQSDCRNKAEKVFSYTFKITHSTPRFFCLFSLRENFSALPKMFLRLRQFVALANLTL